MTRVLNPLESSSEARHSWLSAITKHSILQVMLSLPLRERSVWEGPGATPPAFKARPTRLLNRRFEYLKLKIALWARVDALRTNPSLAPQ
jgi:hypothetical protein